MVITLTSAWIGVRFVGGEKVILRSPVPRREQVRADEQLVVIHNDGPIRLAAIAARFEKNTTVQGISQIVVQHDDISEGIGDTSAEPSPLIDGVDGAGAERIAICRIQAG